MRVFKFMKNNKKFFLFVLIVTVIWALLLNTISVTTKKHQEQIVSLETIKETENYEAILNNIIKKIELVKVYVETVGFDNITQNSFSDFVERTDFSDIGFLSLNLAPDGIIAFYYSDVLDEEDLIGHNFFEDSRESVRNAIDYTIEHDVVVVNGPIDLLLANQGIVLRRAVFENSNFTGIISLVIDMNQLSALFEQTSSNVIDLGVYQTDNTLIFGDLEYSDDLLSVNNIDIDEVDWRIGVKINDSFASESQWTEIFILATGNLLYLMAIGLGGLLYFRNKKLINKQIELINYDNLTQLPNRRLLEKDVNHAISNNQPFYLCFGDLDNFKYLNDILGH
ncbi:MAG: diguanylate cyclase [Tenericutes bacterium]|nr:diguanylate cyclase [Mycoplasmatota bacterium]